MRLAFVMIADLRLADIPAFQQDEAAVLPLLVRHGVRLERRMRSNDAMHKVHIVPFESREGLRVVPDRRGATSAQEPA